MNPDKGISRENRPEKKEFGLHYKIDEENKRIYLGGDPKKLGEFLGRLDAEHALKSSGTEEELEKKIRGWITILEDYVKANHQEKEEKIRGRQLNFGAHRVFVREPQELRLLEKLGLKKLVEEGKVKSPELVLQYLFNGDPTPEHFEDIKGTFEKLRAEMEK